MIEDIVFGEDEFVFDLSGVGLEGSELVISPIDGCYITTDTDFFPVSKDFSNFIVQGDGVQIKYVEEDDEDTEEGSSILNMTNEQFEAIKKAITSLEIK